MMVRGSSRRTARRSAVNEGTDRGILLENLMERLRIKRECPADVLNRS